jgi:hypothetical protein
MHFFATTSAERVLELGKTGVLTDARRALMPV